MNIFYLDEDPILAAKYHCDVHVVKMILETAQILSTVWNSAVPGHGKALYRTTHAHHPCVLWAGACFRNYLYTSILGLQLCLEYKARYGRQHKSEIILNQTAYPPPALRIGERRCGTFPTLAMPEEFYDPDPVAAYRHYYRVAKKPLLKYRLGNWPWWLAENDNELPLTNIAKEY